METEKQKKQRLIKHNDVVSTYALGLLKREFGVSMEAIRSAISAVGNHPDRISYYLRAGKYS